MVRYDLYTIKNNVYNWTKKNDITPGGGVRKFFNILQNIYIHLKKYCLHIIQNTFFSQFVNCELSFNINHSDLNILDQDFF